MKIYQLMNMKRNITKEYYEVSIWKPHFLLYNIIDVKYEIE